MLLLINTNLMSPPIAPLGLDYLAGALRAAGIEVELLDLCLTACPDSDLAERLSRARPELVGLSFRNADDCFWPSAAWFVPDLDRLVRRVRALTDAPVVLGGVGFSVLAEAVLQYTGADFGVRGDGERAIVALARELRGRRRFENVPGLLWRADGRVRRNPPAWDEPLSLPAARDFVDNALYFRLGGQGGVETKRGCDRPCIYCADPLAKGRRVRPRPAGEVADEVESLLRQGVDVLHLCDGEFNVPYAHALAVCEELARRGLGGRVRWYAYMAVVPFDAALAGAMRRAGCVGIDFTGDSACPEMLARYRHRHAPGDLATAVRLCKENGIAVMVDLLLGGPGETPETLARTIEFMKGIDPDAVGAALGVRIWPGTPMAEIVAGEGPMEANPALRRRYDGCVDLVRPTFYVSGALGDRPATMVRGLIAGDERFFEPADDPAEAGSDANYNYNDNTVLVSAIASGERGAFWHILRKLRGS
jgi:radical SAM superfamily enzyme YgiQ (UPF0313 family)